MEGWLARAASKREREETGSFEFRILRRCFRERSFGSCSAMEIGRREFFANICSHFLIPFSTLPEKGLGLYLSSND